MAVGPGSSVPPADVPASREHAETGYFEAFFRRALDIAVSLAGLAISSPLLLVLAILVKWDSRGPVLFRQTRIGRDRRSKRSRASFSERRSGDSFGQPFTLYKFRTMYVDARERFPELYRYSYSNEELTSIPIKLLVGQKSGKFDRSKGGPPLPVDPRVTPLGHFLRRTSLDELPNLFNVLKGDMHLVGPRPDIVANIRYYTPAELEILRAKPGVTGLAQIKGRGHLTFKETNAYDLEYMRQRSLWTDVKILLRTIPTLVKREGAY
jgi:lipopolysaccharide/colanic/teichoic acid biosynthesis glycosyltransferase